jgi:hypothetical protein
MTACFAWRSIVHEDSFCRRDHLRESLFPSVGATVGVVFMLPPGYPDGFDDIGKIQFIENFWRFECFCESWTEPALDLASGRIGNRFDDLRPHSAQYSSQH